MNTIKIIIILGAGILLLIAAACASVNIFAARFYRLTEHERVSYLGLRSIDTLSAKEYIMFETAQERSHFYDDYWYKNVIMERDTFEQRIAYAFKTFGKHAPLTDDRISIYVRYGAPSVREEISPQKRIAIKVKDVVKPAEVWRYGAQGLLFDFIRIASAYVLIATSEFGENVAIPYLKEIARDTVIDVMPIDTLLFSVATGRYRQHKNLTRLEIYISVEIKDTTGYELYRKIKVYNNEGTHSYVLQDVLIPTGSADGIFCDEANLWMEPDIYHVEIELTDLNGKRKGYAYLDVDLIEYLDDAKEISDLIPATLIDEIFTHAKFEKPVGRVIPMVMPTIQKHMPFYLYCEAYNLSTDDGMHNIKTVYEVYNKKTMRQEVVDAIIRNDKDFGQTAYLAAEYHPMDLDAGSYMIVLRIEDLISGQERTALYEFEILEND
ncbi:hypothetical protein A2Y85_02855 [candidate division WOR-3 bacterium RBG_13_43_14]|uniref:GWxTD domain-containing protein n=1 Tax=candidate division WOR-3 bacterium RBG_13_43_14 TaxID=1802590 RepID=A0A1F4UA21_UNCW3|nr:MAG: hypothetical protein A2Y85_02855 [candidate division WOR-3 bacterium RBG_13_43_14]